MQLCPEFTKLPSFGRLFKKAHTTIKENETPNTSKASDRKDSETEANKAEKTRQSGKSYESDNDSDSDSIIYTT